jgi:hypothetical protein
LAHNPIMPMTVLALDQVWIDDAQLPVARGRLLVQRHDPLPGLPGTWRWSASVEPDRRSAAENVYREPVRFRARTVAGLEVSGLVRISSVQLGSDRVDGLELTGVGPLAGFDEALLA